MSATTMDSVAKVEDVNSNDGSASSVQQPGEVIRPVVADGAVEELLERLYGMTVLEVKEMNSYDDRNYFVMVAEEHTNPAVTQLYPGGYLLKITNAKYSKDHHFIEAQHSFMSHLRKHGIRTQNIVPNLNGDDYSLEVIYTDKDKTAIHGQCMVELRTFIPGRVLQDVPYTPEILKENGQLMAKMSVALKDFHHRFFATRDILWSLTNVPLLTNYTFCLKDEDNRRVVEEVVAAFNEEVVSVYDQIPKGYIHGDPNEQNILVSQDETSGQYHISGILDFSDVANSYPIMDLGISIGYLMIDSDVIDQMDVAGYILAGYLETRDLTETEWRVLPLCIAGRLAQSLTLGAHASYMDPGHDYVLTTAKKGWPLLRKYWSHSREELVSRWKNISSSISGK